MNFNFSFGVPNESKAFTMKRPSSAFGNSNHQGKFISFFLQEGMWIVLREVRRG